MKNIKNLFPLLFLTLLFNGCSEDSNDAIFLNFSITHDTYTNTQSRFSSIEIMDEHGNILERESNVGGDNPTWNISMEVHSPNISLFSTREGGRTVMVSDLTDGDSVSWNTADTEATVIRGGNSGNGGDGDGERNCKDWTIYNTSCLSSVADGTGSSLAGMRARVCKLSETSTTITVRSEIEAINGGIDNIAFYKGIKIYYGDGTSRYISKEDFNSQGQVIYEFTVNKAAIHSELGWDDLGNGGYAIVNCEQTNHYVY